MQFGFDAMAKFSSDFLLHMVSGQSMAGGVVPVNGGLVITAQVALKSKKVRIRDNVLYI